MKKVGGTGGRSRLKKQTEQKMKLEERTLKANRQREQANNDAYHSM